MVWKVSRLLERRLEGQREQEPRGQLRAGLHDPQLLQQVVPLAVEALLARSRRGRRRGFEVLTGPIVVRGTPVVPRRPGRSGPGRHEHSPGRRGAVHPGTAARSRVRRSLVAMTTLLDLPARTLPLSVAGPSAAPRGPVAGVRRGAAACRPGRDRAPRRRRPPARAHARLVPAGDPAWAPTTSSPTSSPPRTACWSPATRTTSAAPPTSPTTPSSPTARTTKVIDGRAVTGWFTEDFTLAELQTLRAKERLPAGAARQHRARRPLPDPDVRRGPRPGAAESRAHRPRRSASTPRPSTRRTSTRSGCRSRSRCCRAAPPRARPPGAPRSSCSPSRPATCARCAATTALPLVQLIDCRRVRRTTWSPPGDPRRTPTWLTPAGLRRGRGVRRRDRPQQGPGAAPRPGHRRHRRRRRRWSADAHDAGLAVHVYTLRDENQFMATNFRLGSDPHAPATRSPRPGPSSTPGVDGFFTDHAGTVVEAREQWRAAAAAAG